MESHASAYVIVNKVMLSVNQGMLHLVQVDV